MPPEYVLRGLRMGLGVFLCTAIAYCGINSRLIGKGPGREHLAKLVGDAARSAAITCVVVASPVVGKVLVVGLDRTIGTILGGVCGFASFLFAHKIWNGEYLPTYATLSVLTFFAAFGSVVIAWRLAKLETTPRLFTLTYVLVALGSMEPESDLEVMVSRIVGIMSGSFISLLVAIFVYPVSATEEVLRSIKEALQGLARLNAAAIQEGKHALGHARESDLERDEEAGLESPLLSFEEAASHSQECEDGLMIVVASLSKANSMLSLSQNEAYVGTFCGRMWFLPGLVWCGFKHIPKEQIKAVQEVLTDIRCTAWLLWRIHLAFRQMAFRQGMGAHFALVLTKMLPQDVILRLATSAQQAFDCLVTAFPAVKPTSPGLEKFKQTVAEVIQLTGQQHRQLLHHMRLEQSAIRQQPFTPQQTPAPPCSSLPESSADDGKDEEGELMKGAERGQEEGSEQRLWDAIITEIRRAKPDSDVGAERNFMNAEQPSGAAPGDKAGFPSCAEEQVAEVRWFTFQFLMEELAEALECLYQRLNHLTQLLPDPAIQLHCKAYKEEKGLV